MIVEIEINGQMSISSAFVLGTQAAMRLGLHGVRFDYDDLNCRAFWDGYGTAYEWDNEENLVGRMPVYSPTFEWTEYGEKLMAERREAKEREERERREAEARAGTIRAVLDAKGNHVPNCGCPECQTKHEESIAITPPQTQWWEYVIVTIAAGLVLWAGYSWLARPFFAKWNAQTTVEYAASGITAELEMWQRVINGRRAALKWAEAQGLAPVRVDCELSRCVVEVASETWYLQGCLDGACEIEQRNFQPVPLPGVGCWDCLGAQCKVVPCQQ